MKHVKLGGGFEYVDFFQPRFIGEMSPILTSIFFQDGLVQPPTSKLSGGENGPGWKM